MSPQFNSTTTIDDVAEAYAEKLPGRSYLITGATNGLGLEFCKFIASKGVSAIIITGRSEERLQKSVSDIKAVVSKHGLEEKTIVQGIFMDLADLNSIREAAIKINTLGITINILVNNAGIALVPYQLVNGYESHFSVNHLGHFLFTNLIIDNISKGGRIVNMSSRAHGRSPVRFDDINFQGGKVYEKWRGYGQSKSANILFSISLSKRLKQIKGVESFSVHPGAIMTTNLVTHVDVKEEGLQAENGEWNIPTLTEAQGIAAYLYAAISPEIEGKGGAYLSQCGIGEPLSPMTEEMAERLWEMSNRMLGTSF